MSGCCMDDQCKHDIHVVPDNGKHEDSPDCFCKPELHYQDEFTGRKVWSHKSDEEMNQ